MGTRATFSNACGVSRARACVRWRQITDVNEPPVVGDVTVDVAENAAVGDIIGDGVFSAVDYDAGDAGSLTYRIVSGDPRGTFGFTSAGKLVVAAAGRLDFDARPSYTVLVEVSDGVHSTTAAVVINVIDVNNPPQLTGATFEVEEESPVNTAVGEEPTVSDADESDTLLFNLESGNIDDAFKVAACGGQIRVNRDVLDYEGTTQLYTLNISVRGLVAWWVALCVGAQAQWLTSALSGVAVLRSRMTVSRQ